jgi:hypothetical protein
LAEVFFLLRNSVKCAVPARQNWREFAARGELAPCSGMAPLAFPRLAVIALNPALIIGCYGPTFSQHTLPRKARRAQTPGLFSFPTAKGRPAAAPCS